MWSPELYASHPGSSGGDSRDGVGRGAGDDGGGPVLGAPGAVAGPVAHAHPSSVSKPVERRKKLPCRVAGLLRGGKIDPGRNHVFIYWGVELSTRIITQM